MNIPSDDIMWKNEVMVRWDKSKSSLSPSPKDCSFLNSSHTTAEYGVLTDTTTRNVYDGRFVTLPPSYATNIASANDVAVAFKAASDAIRVAREAEAVHIGLRNRENQIRTMEPMHQHNQFMLPSMRLENQHSMREHTTMLPSSTMLGLVGLSSTAMLGNILPRSTSSYYHPVLHQGNTCFPSQRSRHQLLQSLLTSGWNDSTTGVTHLVASHQVSSSSASSHTDPVARFGETAHSSYSHHQEDRSAVEDYDCCSMSSDSVKQKETKNQSARKKKRTAASVKKSIPADLPRRPLTAYNIFFSAERKRILGEDPESNEFDLKQDEELTPEKEGELLELLLTKASQKKRRKHRKMHGKISFKELATLVGKRWRALPPDRLKRYKSLAEADKRRCKAAMEEYYRKYSVGEVPGGIAPDATARKKLKKEIHHCNYT
eukprot:scaffold156847_cov66-Attheya_sp.AAC.3